MIFVFLAQKDWLEVGFSRGGFGGNDTDSGRDGTRG